MARWKRIASKTHGKRGAPAPGKVRYRKRVRCRVTGRKLARVVRG